MTLSPRPSTQKGINGRVFDGVDLGMLATGLGTPLHVYSASAIRARINQLQRALYGMDALICYAVKANSNLAILQLMGDSGVGADMAERSRGRRLQRQRSTRTTLVWLTWWRANACPASPRV